MKFQDDISNLHTHTRSSRNQYVPHFFKVGGIKSISRGVRLLKQNYFLRRFVIFLINMANSTIPSELLDQQVPLISGTTPSLHLLIVLNVCQF